MASITRIQTPTGTRILFGKNWEQERDKIDAIRFVPGQEFPGAKKPTANLNRREIGWDAQHPLITHQKLLGDHLWKDPVDPMYLVGAVPHIVDRPDPKDKEGKRKVKVTLQLAVWRNRTWRYQQERAGIRYWTSSKERPDPKVMYETPDEDEDPANPNL